MAATSAWREDRETELATLKVMCARSMHVAVGALAERFERASGHSLACDFGTVGGLQAKLDAGETADVLILSVAMIDKLDKAGALVPDSRADVARTYVAVCVREGAAKPDIATPEAFERTLRSARAIAFSAAGVGGSAGIYLAGLFERMGLTAMMAEKGLPQQTGAEVAKRVVEGTAEIGLTLSGEIASVKGAVIAGPLPPPIGSETTYAAAVWAGSEAKGAALELVRSLTAADTRETWKVAGF
jgi:molybdate transport system substrate-binding protein